MSCNRLALFVLGFCTAVLLGNDARLTGPQGPEKGFPAVPAVSYANGLFTGP